jgi:hypothetical protein
MGCRSSVPSGTIRVYALSPPYIDIKVRDNELKTVKDIKKVIQLELGIPPTNQRLVNYLGTAWTDDALNVPPRTKMWVYCLV